MSKPGRCDTCAHDGCCEHYCGGAYWSDAYGKCAQCGREVLLEMADVTHGDKVFCCPECYDNWAAENDIDDDEGS